MRVIFFQLKGRSYGGVWQVNKIVSEELLKHNIDVSVLSLRNNHDYTTVEYDKRLRVDTINDIDIWEDNYSKKDIIESLKRFRFIEFFRRVNIRIKHEISIIKDKKKVDIYLEKENPDIIITSHYQLLDVLPKKYLSKTYHEQHSSFDACVNNKAIIKILNKYNNKVKFIWLAKESMNSAIKYGLKNNYYIYNAVRFRSNIVSDVVKNKKLITIARFAKEKNIKEMVSICKEIFKDKRYSDWSLEIFGNGSLEKDIRKEIGSCKQIKLMGVTNNPKEELLKASINLNTSFFEGFCLSILEANECGVPTISYNYWESVYEEILDNKTGYICTNKDEFKNKLQSLMDDNDKLKEMSKNAKEFNKHFVIEEIIKDWIKLFNGEL